MRLHQTVIFENEYTPGAPGHSTQLVDLTLKEIVDAGKVTNPYQLFILGRVSNFFRMGYKSVDLQLENPVNYGDESTSSATKAALLAMSDADHVALAQYLLDSIRVGESLLYDQRLNVIEWMRYVLAKQD
jgi:hypothetical protein